jgi:hypothetical protein|tara:strand:- start:3334 stop:3699 length:366 start_codon:yes stop_codon:yes gene_type:complete
MALRHQAKSNFEEIEKLRLNYREKYNQAQMMTAPVEHAYCHWLIKNHYTGHADIVELGCFLGSMSRALVNGLKENQTPSAHERKIQVYDRFVWIENMDQWTAGLKLENRPEIGSSYKPLYE